MIKVKVYTCIYLVSIFFRFVELCSAKNKCIYLLHIYPSVDFLSKYIATSPEEIFSFTLRHHLLFFMVKNHIKSNHNNLLSFNY